MMDDAKNTYKVPTPQDSLESQIMDPNFPKNEREWWAAAEIVFPALAGMDRRAADAQAWVDGVPRARGDGPRSPWFSALHEPPINGGPYSLYERQCPYGNLGSAVELVGKKALINSACSKCQWRGLLREDGGKA